jgi:ABC-type Mn2+/Zn2+ transport system permease subunit
MRRAFAEVALLAVSGGAIGCWVVQYRLSYSAESLAHGLFPGLVVAALAGLPLLLGGLVGILIAAAGVALAGRIPSVGSDTAVAIVVTALFGLGALLALSAATPPGLANLLFGDVLAVTDGDLALGAALAVVTFLALRVLHGRLLAVGFDRGSARAVGASPLLADAALLLLLALATVVAVRALGNLLVVALLVGPAATARRLANRMAPMIAIAGALGILAGIGGLYLSYYVHAAAGASIAGTIVVIYLVVELACALLRARRGPRGLRLAAGDAGGLLEQTPGAAP